MLRIFFIFFISMNVTFAGVINTFSKKRARKLISKLKSENKKPRLKRIKAKRDVFVVFNLKTKKVIKIFLSLDNAKEYLSLKKSRSLKLNKTQALVNKYIISYSQEDTPEFSEEDEKSEISSSLEYLPMKFRYLNGNNLQENDYDSNFFTLNFGLEYIRGNFWAVVKPLFQSNDVNGQFDDDRLIFQEGYLKYASDFFEVSVGSQIRVWGVFDELSELDILTLKNTQRVLFDDGVDLRRPLNVAYLSKYFGDSKLELVLNFGNESGYYNNVNDTFYGIKKDEKSIRGAEIPAAFQNVIPSLGVVNKPRETMGFASRLSFSFNSNDVQLVASKMLSDLPNIILTEQLLLEARSLILNPATLQTGLEMEYQEITTLGGAFVRQMGKFLFKAELAYKDGYTLLTQDLYNVQLSRISSNVGGEYEFDASNSTIRFQINSIMYQTPEELALDNESHLLAGEFVTFFMGEKLRTSFRFSYELEDQGYMISPRLSYDLNDNSKIGLRAFIFGGNELSDLGYHQNDNFFELEYRFTY